MAEPVTVTGSVGDRLRLAARGERRASVVFGFGKGIDTEINNAGCGQSRRTRAGQRPVSDLAYYDPHKPGVRHSADWLVTSGSLFALNGAGWTGRPDDVSERDFQQRQ